MVRFRLPLALLLLALLLLAACSQVTPQPATEVAQQADPTVVYSQTGTKTESLCTNPTTYSGPPAYSIKPSKTLYDDFTVPTGQTFTLDHLRLWSNDPRQGMEISLAASNSGMRGQTFHTFSSVTSTVSDGVHTVSFDPVTLQAGTYWLGIDTGGPICWKNSSDRKIGNDAQLYTGVGTGANTQSQSQSFAVYLDFELLGTATTQATPDLYTLDFEKVPVDRLVYSVSVDKGITYSGNGTPNQGLIRVEGNRFLNGKTLYGNQAKVIRGNGGKRLTVAKPNTNTPNPQGGLLVLQPNTEFAPPGMGGRNGLVTVKSITVHNVTSSGSIMLCGNGICSAPLKLKRAAKQTLSFDQPNVGTIRIQVNNAFSVDDVVLEVPAVVPPNPCGSNANSRC